MYMCVAINNAKLSHFQYSPNKFTYPTVFNSYWYDTVRISEDLLYCNHVLYYLCTIIVYALNLFSTFEFCCSMYCTLVHSLVVLCMKLTCTSPVHASCIFTSIRRATCIWRYRVPVVSALAHFLLILQDGRRPLPIDTVQSLCNSHELRF